MMRGAPELTVIWTLTMNDLQEYLKLQDLISEAKIELSLREQIKLLNSKITKLEKSIVTARKNASKHKRANDKLREKYGLKTPSKSDKARELIRQRENGDKSLTLKSISEQCFLGYSTVKALVRDVRSEST